MFPRIMHIYGPLSINSYGLMIAIGFLLFIYLTYKHPKRSRLISSDVFFNMMFVGLIAGIVGGRLFFVFSEWETFSDNWLEVFYPWIGGFGVLGSIIGILLVVSLYLKWNKVKILPVLDLAAIYVPLMQSIARIGCFLAGCCYGNVASPKFWGAITFTNPQGLAPLNIPLHPTQIYSSLASILIFLIVYFKAKYFSFKKGQILFTYLFLESLARFTVDFWRGDRDMMWSMFSYSQFVAVGIFFVAVVGFLLVAKKK